jgi:hypothetical protein
MLEHIILLTAQTQQQFALSELLKVYNPRLRFHAALNAADRKYWTLSGMARTIFIRDRRTIPAGPPLTSRCMKGQEHSAQRRI